MDEIQKIIREAHHERTMSPEAFENLSFRKYLAEEIQTEEETWRRHNG